MSEPERVVAVLGSFYALPNDTADQTGAAWSRCLTSANARPIHRQVDSASDPCLWTSAITVDAIERASGRLLMLHASGLADADGNVVALVGPSGTGKSTAARVLAATDFGYVTDETVAVDIHADHLRVLPLPRPLALTPDRGGPKIQLSPDELGLRQCGERLTLAGIIRLHRSPGHGPPTAHRLGVVEAAQVLVPETSGLLALSHPVWQLVTTIRRCGGVLEVAYAEAADLGPCLQEALTARPLEDQVSHYPGASPVRLDSADPEAWARTGFTDAAADADGVLVLREGTTWTLQGVGAAIWKLAATPMTTPALVAELERQFGAHPQSDAVVDQALQDLAHRGLIRSGSQHLD